MNFENVFIQLSVPVELIKLHDVQLTLAFLIDECDQLVDLLRADGEVEVGLEASLEVGGSDVALVTLVENFEAVVRLFELVNFQILANYTLQLGEADARLTLEVDTELAQLLLRLLLRHVGEAKVVQNVLEVLHTDEALLLLVVEFESISQVDKNIVRQLRAKSGEHVIQLRHNDEVVFRVLSLHFKLFQ